MNLYSTSSNMQQKRQAALSPLQMMQKLYNSYNKNSVYERKNASTIQSALPKKSNSAHKMTNFLLKHTRNNKTEETQMSENNQSKNDLSMFKNKFRANLTPQMGRTQNRVGIDEDKRGYFRSIYSDSHPILLSEFKLQTKQIQNCATKVVTEPALSIDPHLYEPSAAKNCKLSSPKQRRNEIKQVKQKMIRIKNIKRQKMQKVRYNYLISNCFKSHLAKQPLKLSFKPKADTYVKTRESIFPTVFEFLPQREDSSQDK